MSGRYEKDMQLDEKMQKKLNNLPEIFSEYYYSLISSGKSYTTASSYIGYVVRFAKYTFNGDVPEEFYLNVTFSHINHYIASLRTKTVHNIKKRTSDSLKTVHWSALNSFFNFLIPNYINENPVEQTTRPKMKDNPKVTYLTEEEISLVLNNVLNTANKRFINRDLCLMKLGFTTGLRISAISQIDIDDIDFDSNQIHVVEKGDKEYDVYMGDNLKQQILLWMEDRNKYFHAVKTNALFVSQELKRLSPRTVRDILEKYCSITNKHVTPHVMRHTCATNLYEKTNDIYLCSAQLHHANVSTTQRYAEISDKKKIYATNILDNLI